DRKAVARLRALGERLRGEGASGAPASASAEWRERLEAAQAQFDACLDDDLNVSGGLGVVHETAKALGRGELGPDEAAAGLAFLEHADAILGVIFAESSQVEEGLSPEEQELLEARGAAREARDWARSDELRDALLARGIVIKDGADGVTWERRR
ncbi:MAG: CysS/YqeB C-terminal domain-containing protein, partial [Planctomycetota bacterium]